MTYINRLIKGVNGRDCEFEDPCLNGGGCQHDCQAVGSLAVCSCYDGFELDHDDKTCADINECETGDHRCDQPGRGVRRFSLKVEFLSSYL